jgi:DNA-binding GntR family transcriptional regulator
MTAEENPGGLVIAPPVPMRKQVYEHLRNQILNRTIPPAGRLVETQIAKAIGISRTPAREALHLLEKDGFLKAMPRVGYSVKELSWDELDEIFEIRKINELLACRWAVERIDSDGIKSLEANLTRVDAILQNGAPDEFPQQDQDFHEIIFQAAGSKHLWNICQQLSRLMLRYRAESIRSTETVKKALAGHVRILQCLKKRDPKGLENAMIAHLDYSKNDIRKGKIR